MMNIKLRLGFVILLILPIVLFLSGCWDLVNIKERTIIVGMGLDRIEGVNPILLTAQVINLATLKSGVSGGMKPGGSISAGGGKGSQVRDSVVIEISKGKSLEDAVNNFLEYSPRRVTFTHNRIIVLGRELAQRGVAEVFDEMARDYQFRATNWIFVAENNARQILESQTELGTVPAKEMDQMMINMTKNPFIPPENSNELVLQLTSEAKTAYAPLAEIENAGPDQSPRIIIEKMAIFKNNRFIGILNRDESQSLLWFADKKKGGSLSVPFRFEKNQTQKATIRISDGTTQIRPRRTANGIRMDISCTGKGTLYGMPAMKNDPATIRLLEHQVAKIMARRLRTIIQKAQDLKADFLGYARLIHSQYPDEWHRMKRNWDEEFPRLESKVRFQIEITRFGLVKDSILQTGVQGE